MSNLTINDTFNKAIKSGLSGASAMTIQVSSLMWMRTTMNYQYTNGGTFLKTIPKLYNEGGIPRFYRGLVPALMIGPLSRFGDTAANGLALHLTENNDFCKNMPIFVSTGMASILAGSWRIFVLPIDAWKTSKQVHGADGLKLLSQKMKINGVSTLYQGAMASSLATMVGHYPWFLTYNYLNHYFPKIKFEDDLFKALIRNASIGFSASLVSDTVSNSIRVVKTVKQTNTNKITYQDAIKSIIKESGMKGLFFRGLETKLLTNGIQGMCFSVFFKLFQETMN